MLKTKAISWLFVIGVALSLPATDPAIAENVKSSDVTSSFTVYPIDLNGWGGLSGGRLLSEADRLTAICVRNTIRDTAAKLKFRTTTLMVESFKFKSCASQNEIVTAKASVFEITDKVIKVKFEAFVDSAGFNTPIAEGVFLYCLVDINNFSKGAQSHGLRLEK